MSGTGTPICQINDGEIISVRDSDNETITTRHQIYAYRLTAQWDWRCIRHVPKRKNDHFTLSLFRQIHDVTLRIIDDVLHHTRQWYRLHGSIDVLRDAANGERGIEQRPIARSRKHLEPAWTLPTGHRQGKRSCRSRARSGDRVAPIAGWSHCPPNPPDPRVVRRADGQRIRHAGDKIQHAIERTDR